MNELYIYRENSKYLKKYGKLGLYLIIAENELSYDDFETEVEKEKYLLEFVNKYTDRFEKKLAKYEHFFIDAEVIDERVTSVIEYLSLKKLVFIQGYSNDFKLITKLAERKNVYLYNVPLVKLNMEQLEIYINLLKKKKVVKKNYNVNTRKDTYVFNNSFEFSPVNIKSVNDFYFLINILKDNNNIKQFTLNVNVVELDLLKGLDTFLNYIDNLDSDLSVNINLNFDVKNLEISKIPRVSADGHKWNINAYGINFNDYYEFYYFNKIISFLNDKIPKDASDLEKVVFISNFIVNFIDYDTLTYGKRNVNENGDRVNSSFLDVLASGSGVCRHYADLATVLFDFFNIKCEYVGSDTIEYVEAINNNVEIEYDEDGRLVNEDFIGHAFNIIYLDGKPYWLDLTWCDFEEYSMVEDENFLVSSDTFLRGHSSFVEVENHYCGEDYDKDKIQQAIDNVLSWDVDVSVEEMNNLPYNIGVNIVRNNAFKPKVNKKGSNMTDLLEKYKDILINLKGLNEEQLNYVVEYLELHEHFLDINLNNTVRSAVLYALSKSEGFDDEKSFVDDGSSVFADDYDPNSLSTSFSRNDDSFESMGLEQMDYDNSHGYGM